MADRYSQPPITRRDFLISGVAAAAALSGRGFAQTGQPPVDQNPIRRRGTGLRGLDEARASPGLTLFAPMGDTAVHLIDLRGMIVHTWHMPYRPGLYGYLTDRGTLFFNGQIPNDTFLGKQPFMGGAAMEVDWNGKVLWELRRPDHHHDGRRLRNGNVVLLCGRELPADIAKRVRGGRPGTEVDGKAMWADVVVEATTDGKVVWEWRSWEHLDPEKDVIIEVQGTREEWTHANSVFEEPDGNLLVSFRNISTVIRIERSTGKILWKLGAPPLGGQHAPYRLANGNILMFDNGPHRLDHTFPYSRAIEVNSASNEIVWKYQEAREFIFFSPRISNAVRLPNGNTLINEGSFGRFFEVTREGDVVWEYVNPFFGPATQTVKLRQNNVFRVYRYSDEEIAQAQSQN